MHRDIKPHNVLINHPKRILKIVDFGLADFYFPEKDYSSKVASLYYKAPELLLGSVRYDYSIDVWAAGIIMAGLVIAYLTAGLQEDSACARCGCAGSSIQAIQIPGDG